MFVVTQCKGDRDTSHFEGCFLLIIKKWIKQKLKKKTSGVKHINQNCWRMGLYNSKEKFN